MEVNNTHNLLAESTANNNLQRRNTRMELSRKEMYIFPFPVSVLAQHKQDKHTSGSNINWKYPVENYGSCHIF